METKKEAFEKLTSSSKLENYFSAFRSNIIGQNLNIRTPQHESIPLIYADWTASGRLYSKIEEKLKAHIYPLVANTHTDTSLTGSATTYAYHKAQEIIKKHVNASSHDILISSGAGMTAVINKLQRILGLKIHEKYRDLIAPEDDERPVVFVTHMEHHSNQTSWYETLADVVVVPPGEDGLVSPDNFRRSLKKYNSRKTKIAAITSCSNVTGISTPYMDIARLVHQEGGLCFVDFACSAPYININMHENDAEGRYLDAIYFSPHKFLGGPGSSGILLFNEKLYENSIPDNPGGGTVDWTNPWGEHKYVDDIEAREDGGTPGFLQTIRTAMCCKLKEEMGVQNIEEREKEILDIIWSELENVDGLHILAEEHKDRLGIISFYINGLHYNLGVKMLNDHFGIQTRGGCSCAGTYGHYLLNVTQEYSKKITDLISKGDCSTKPGWIRLSIHPTHTDDEIHFICKSIRELAGNHRIWKKDYNCDFSKNLIEAKDENLAYKNDIDECFARDFL